MPDWAAIAGSLESAGYSIDLQSAPRAVGGGDINAAWRATTDSGCLFLKTGNADAHAMFAAEAAGLAELAAAEAVRVPVVIACELVGADSFLALDWIEFDSPTAESERLLGAQLAALHRVTAARHGWDRDNTIGSTPQINTPCTDWIEFYRDYRLAFQLDLAATNGFRGRLQETGKRLLGALPALLADHQPEPSLLHGDLWGGNHASAGSEPVIFDPAVYYGDRETDLAMTRLFGGFPAAFYTAYEEAWPLPAGHERRNGLYQLYHVLNHLNLFGSAYLGRAEALLESVMR